MGADRAESMFSVIEGGRIPCLLAICAAELTASEAAECAALPADIEVMLIRETAARSLATLCRRHGLTLADTVVVATRPQDLPFTLEARVSLALKGAGYENEVAADRVFPPRSAGGLVQAIRYVGVLAAMR